MNYALALKNYSRNGKGRLMKRFCEGEGYDYSKFLQYFRHGQKEYSVLKGECGGFIPLVVNRSPDRSLGVAEPCVRFTNGMEFTHGEGVIDEMRMNPNTPKSIYVFGARNPRMRIKKILVREHNRYELTRIRLENGCFFSPVMDSERRFGKISWSDLVMLKKTIKYTVGEWPAMKRVLEIGDVELSNNLIEQMMRSIKMNLKNAGNIGSEESARHTFMFLIIESSRMCGRSVKRYLTGLLEKLKTAKDGDDLACCLPCFMPA